MTGDTPGEAARRRRRWISLAEVVGILALAISAASLWDSHQDRMESRASAGRATPTRPAPLVLAATAEADGDRLRIAAPNRDRIIQTQTIVFPTALAVASIDTVGNSRIEAGWFAAGLRRAVGDERGAGRLPVGIVTRYTDDGVERSDTAIYDIGHDWRERLLQPDVPVLEGITLVARGGDRLQQRIDARWQRSHPPR